MRGRLLLTVLFTLAGSVGLTPAGEVRAQEPPLRGPAPGVTNDTLLLTLDEAVRRAGTHNPAVRRATNDLELNQIETRDFWLGFLPQPQINFLSTNMQWNRTTVATDNFGNPIANPEERMIQSAFSGQSASLNFRLDPGDFFARRANHLQADRRLVDAERARRELASEVRLLFLDAQERLEFQELENSLLEVRRIHHGITEQHFRLGRVDRSELIESELDVVGQEHELEQRGAELRSALLAVRNRIGDPSLQSFEIEPVPLRIFDPAQLDQEAILEAALRDGPRVRDERFQLWQAENQVLTQRADWLPTLQLTAATDRQAFSRESGNAFFQPLPDGEWGRRISLTVSFPDLGQYFLRQNTARRTQLEIRNADESLREVVFQVEEEVRTLLLDLESHARTVELQGRRVDLAEERLDLQQELYRLGSIDYLELQTAAETASNARRQWLQARYAFERARIQLEQALGADLEVSLDGAGDG